MDLPQLRQSEQHMQHRPTEERKDLRGQAKLAEMGEEVRRRQNRIISPPHQQAHPQYPAGYYPAHYSQQAPGYQPPPQQNYHQQVTQNSQNLQNLNLNQQYSAYQVNKISK